MADTREIIIKIYTKGAVGGFPCFGQDAYLEDRDFLDKMTGREYHNFERPIPDPDHDIWVLDEQQFDAFLDFRKSRRDRSSG